MRRPAARPNSSKTVDHTAASSTPAPRRVLIQFAGTWSNDRSKGSPGLDLARGETWDDIYVLYRAGGEKERKGAEQLAGAIRGVDVKRRVRVHGIGESGWKDSWSRPESRAAIGEWFLNPKSHAAARRNETEYFVSTLTGTAAQWTSLVEQLAHSGCTVSLVRERERTLVHRSTDNADGAKTAEECAVEIAKFPAAWTVLITGPTGTGKSWLARRLHDEWKSRGAVSKDLLPVNIAGIPDLLLESELFGYAKGAFTGADRNKAGLFEECAGGTLFLDEIGELPMALQAKLLTALDLHTHGRSVVREFRSVGSAARKESSFHLVCATNRDLREDVRAGRFREDLLARLSTHEVRTPALSEQRYAIVGLYLDAFVRLATLLGVSSVRPIRPAVQRLLDLALDPESPWTWNRRDVDQAAERVVMAAWRAAGNQAKAGELLIAPEHVASESDDLRKRWKDAKTETADEWQPLAAAMKPEAFRNLSLLDRWEARILLEALQAEGTQTKAWIAIANANRLPHRGGKAGTPSNPADAFAKRWNRFDDWWLPTAKSRV